jgi:hypothetical protein
MADVVAIGAAGRARLGEAGRHRIESGWRLTDVARRLADVLGDGGGRPSGGL